MNSQFAKIFAIQPVRMRASVLGEQSQHPQQHDDIYASAQKLTNKLAEDIKRVIPGDGKVFVASVPEPILHQGHVYLPSQELSQSQKRALWLQLKELGANAAHRKP
ncbi:hypothetical protein AAEU32_08935 [Pseudoalteromonas sp. SSDWG2]|uniref:hypothetical protein n=1 Tax=Pseudoalteromonas sp. SSDWG2 TaxID=3139391 RepID=UPI003BAB1F61